MQHYIDMTSLANNFLSIVGYFSFGFGGYFIRKKIDQDMNKQLEEFKSEINSAYSKNIFVFQRYHERQVEVIAEMYTLIARACDGAKYYTAPLRAPGDPDDDELYRNANLALIEYHKLFDRNRIYLPESLSDQLDDFSKALARPVLRLRTWSSIQNPTDDTLLNKSEVWRESWNEITEKIPPLRSNLERELRLILKGAS